MIEIVSILIHLLVITILCYPAKILVNFFTNEEKNFIQSLEIGVVINIFLLLLLSLFYRKDLNIILYFALFLFLFNLYYLINDFIKSLKNRKTIITRELIILFLLAFILSINISNNLKLGWDAQNYWLVKKLVFTNGGDIFDLKSTPMRSYPYLGSFLWFFYSKISITGQEYFGRIFYIFLYLVSIFSILNIFSLNFINKFLLTIATVFLIYSLNLFNGYQEVLIFSLTVILVKTIYKYLNSIERNNSFNNYFYFIGILIINILLIKNDALIIIFILFIFFCAFLLKYFLFNYINLNNHLQEDNYQNITIIKLLDFFTFERFYLITKYLFFSFLENPIFLIGAIFLLILFKDDKKNRFYLFLLLSYLFSILFIFVVFFLTSLPLEFHLKTAISRVLFEISGFFLIIIPLFFNKFNSLKK